MTTSFGSAWNEILRVGSDIAYRVFTPQVTYYNGSGESFQDAIAMSLHGRGSESVTALWKTQPHLRTVVAYRARNLGQLGLHCYVRGEGDERQRDRTSKLAQLLWYVDGEMTTYDLIFAISGDLDLFDRSYLLVAADASSPIGWSIRRLPPAWVTEVRPNGVTLTGYRIQAMGGNGEPVSVPKENVIRFGGYDPASMLGCSPTIDSLRGTLNEQVEASKYRSQIWKRGGRVSSVLQRPAMAPKWSDAARDAFRTDWYAKFTGSGQFAGGTPILEDGMTLNRVDFSAQDQQFAEVAKLSLTTVAAAFFVEPSMIGQGDGASYSNMKAYRKMLYTETLGPTLRQVEQRLNKSLPGILNLNPAAHFVEFNLQEKLSGDFEEQASILSTSTGAPWMTRNEARARQNLPAMEGGDELIVPLNVLVGGQASPTDSGSQNEVPDAPDRAAAPSRPVKTPALPRSGDKKTPDTETLVRQRLAKFFQRQGRSVLAAIRAGEADYWEAERWDKELGEDLFELFAELSQASAVRALADAGLDPERYNTARTVNFLKEAAKSRAEAINDATEEAVEDAEDPEEVFSEERTDNHAAKVATSVVTFATSFGAVEAGRQTGLGVTKTWRVNSSNPRSSHAAMDGETVGIDDTFSNGLQWPGAFGDAEEVVNCSCDIELNFPS